MSGKLNLLLKIKKKKNYFVVFQYCFKDLKSKVGYRCNCLVRLNFESTAKVFGKHSLSQFHLPANTY